MMTRLGDLIKPANVVRCNNSKYPVLSVTMYDGIMLQNSRLYLKILSDLDVIVPPYTMQEVFSNFVGRAENQN